MEGEKEREREGMNLWQDMEKIRHEPRPVNYHSRGDKDSEDEDTSQPTSHLERKKKKKIHTHSQIPLLFPEVQTLKESNAIQYRLHM